MDHNRTQRTIVILLELITELKLHNAYIFLEMHIEVI